jgi:hypothetical protein
MSATAKAGRLSGRYFWAKFATARDSVMAQVAAARDGVAPPAAAGGAAAGGAAAAGGSAGMGSLWHMFQEAFQKQLTTVVAVTGAAMAPAINPVRSPAVRCCVASMMMAVSCNHPPPTHTQMAALSSRFHCCPMPIPHH